MPDIDRQLPDPDPTVFLDSGLPQTLVSRFLTNITREFLLRGIVVTTTPIRYTYAEFCRLAGETFVIHPDRVYLTKILTTLHDSMNLGYGRPEPLRPKVKLSTLKRAMEDPATAETAVVKTIESYYNCRSNKITGTLKNLALFYRPTLLTMAIETDISGEKLLRLMSRRLTNE